MVTQTLIGLDFGSDSVRAVLVDQYGKQLATAVEAYPRWAAGKFCDATKNQFRQHPSDHLEAMETVVNAVLQTQNRADVVGIAADTTGSTPGPLDINGTPLALLPEFADNPNAMFILWKDHTAIAEAARINEVAANWTTDYRRYIGGIYSSEWFWSKILHTLKVDAKVRDAAFTWCEHGDWVVGELAGNTTPAHLIRGRCANGHKTMWHASWHGLPPDDFFTAIDPLLHELRERLFRDTFTADHPIGTLSAKWAEKWGLSKEVIVGGSALDCHFGAIGAQIEPYQLLKVIGTSTCDIMVAPDVEKCVHGICGQVDGSVLPGMVGLEAGQSAFGDVFAWFKRLLGYAGEISLADLENAAAKIPVGANGVVAIDWLNGRRTPDADQSLTGALFGLTLGADAPTLYRALIESVAFGARAIAERFVHEGVPVKSVAATGGISRKSTLVMQTCADVLNLPIKIAASEQTCALGAAMVASVAAKVYPDIPTAMAVMGQGYDKIYQPQAENVAAYDGFYQRYLAHGALVAKK